MKTLPPRRSSLAALDQADRRSLVLPCPRLPVAVVLDTSESMRGKPLAELGEALDLFLATVSADPEARDACDVAFVSVGQPAIVKLGAYDYSIYGGLDAKVELVSADSTQPQNAQGQSGEPYYVVHIRTAKSAIEYKGKALPVMPGMTASVDVLTGRRSVMHYLLKPINKAREKALTER